MYIPSGLDVSIVISHSVWPTVHVVLLLNHYSRNTVGHARSEVCMERLTIGEYDNAHFT